MPNRRKWSRTHSLLSLHHLRASNRVACPWAVADCGTVSPLQLSTTVRAGGVQDLVCFQVHQCCGDEVLVMKHEGDALQYKGDNKVVMMPWERAYMEACVDAMGVTPKDHVLEIGFGCGYSADRIQSYHPRSHTIVECSVAVLRRLHRWAASKPGIVIVEGTWQRALPHLGRFDAIFFDDFPLPADGAAAALTHDDAAPPAPTHNATLAPPVVTPSYPGMGHRVRLPPARLRHPFAGPCPDFTDELLAVMDTRWSALLGVCVQWHLRVGGRMTGYLARDCVLSHPRCDYSVAPFSVQPPPCCPYFRSSTLYVPCVTLRDAPPPRSGQTKGVARPRTAVKRSRDAGDAGQSKPGRTSTDAVEAGDATVQRLRKRLKKLRQRQAARLQNKHL